MSTCFPRRPGAFSLIVAFSAFVIFAAAQVRAAEEFFPYHLIKEIPIAGDTGWDYLSIDSDARRLYVTRGTHIAVLDLATNSVVGDIADTPHVHGFAIAHAVGRGFSSNGGESKVSIVDLKSLATIGKVATDEGPDAVVYDSGREEAYAFNGHAKSVTVIGARSGKVVASIGLPGRPEFAAVDPAAGRVFVNIEDANEVVAIDSKQHRVIATWPVAPGESPSAMAIDVAHHRLFIGCGNHLMLMMDSESGRVITSVPIGVGVDANAFDDARLLAFSSNGEGSVTIAKEVTASKLVVVQTLATQQSGRTMALDPRTHNIYVAVARFEPAADSTPAAQRHRTMSPGTFRILVYGPSAGASPVQ